MRSASAYRKTAKRYLFQMNLGIFFVFVFAGLFYLISTPDNSQMLVIGTLFMRAMLIFFVLQYVIYAIRSAIRYCEWMRRYEEALKIDPDS